MATTSASPNGTSARPAPPAPSIEDLGAYAEHLHQRGLDPRALHFIEHLLRQHHDMKARLEDVQANQERLRAQHEALTAPAHFPAVITGVVQNGKLTAEVFAGGSFIEVAVSPEIAPERLQIGARGRVTHSRNCLLDVQETPARWSEIATFDAFSCDGDLLVQYQGMMKKIRPVAKFSPGNLRKGDEIGFDPEARLAYAHVEHRDRNDLFLQETPSDRFDELGGLEPQIRLLKEFVSFRLKHSAVADRYRLPTRRGILLHGAPGNGKTKLARALANYIAEISGDGVCRFMSVAGSSDYSMWLGQSEQKYKARFDAVRAVAVAEGVPVVMFWDEIDAIARRRGSSFGGDAPDRILATFLAELDGITQLRNVIVIAATNRIDILDPGLTRAGRLGDELILIPQPGRAGAKAILERYLADLPLQNSLGSIVEPLLSRVFSANGEYAELTRVILRDGRRVPLGGRDLVSGALIENVVRKAAAAAARREVQARDAVQARECGIGLDDLSAALDQALHQAASLLSPSNVRSYVHRLPQDVDPVAIEPVARSASLGLYVRGA
jgi:proteasome-associated ATPase